MKIYLSILLFLLNFQVFGQVGCTDPLALNFDPTALDNDGSCTYSATTIDPLEIVNPLPFSLAEQSGMIKEENQLWIHLDGGNGEKFFIFDLDNLSIQQELDFQNITNTDWEDIAEDDFHFYLGDFGNNVGNRMDLKIWKVAKTDLYDAIPENISPEIISFSYPEQVDFSDQNLNHDFDCEAMIVIGDYIYLFMKEWISNKSSIYRIPNQVGDHSAELMGSLDVNGLVTGAGYDSAHEMVLLIGYEFGLGATPFVYMLWDYNGDDFLSGNKRRIDLNWANHQTESICYDELGKWYIGNEYFEIGPIGFYNQLRQIDISEFLTGVIGIEEIETQQLVLSPNPSSGKFRTNMEYSSLNVYDLKGNLIMELGQNEEVSFQLDNGLYTVEVYYHDKVYREKLLIIR